MGSIQTTHQQLLERFRHSMNLIGPGPSRFHFEDCVLALQGLSPTGHWLDLGSGAGFPGLVFADLFEDCKVTMVESRQKRCTFLRSVVRDSGCDAQRVRVEQCRVERLPAERVQGIMSRAFAPPEKVFPIARERLVKGGTLLFFLQRDFELAVPEDFEEVNTTMYELDGKKRRSVCLSFLG